MSFSTKARRLAESSLLLVRSRAFTRQLRVEPRDDLELLGSRYGGWVVPSRLLDEGSTCYLVGTGTDVSFDLALIERFGCRVHAFDPVPAAQEHARRATAREPRFELHPYGVWSSDGELRFHQPVVDGYVSHSATNLHHTAQAFSAPVRSLPSIMRELGHDHLDLLKVSAEGAEYEILGSVLGSPVDVRVIAVEFAQPSPPHEAEGMSDRLRGVGYAAVYVESTPRVRRVTFVRQPQGAIGDCR